MKFIFVAALASISVAVNAQVEASAPAAEQIAQYKDKTAADCAADATADGMGVSSAHYFCACMTDSVWRNTPPMELQRAFELSMKIRNAKSYRSCFLTFAR